MNNYQTHQLGFFQDLTPTTNHQIQGLQTNTTAITEQLSSTTTTGSVTSVAPSLTGLNTLDLNNLTSSHQVCVLLLFFFHYLLFINL